MAMAPQEWTIHALSVEFNKHPRVIARLLRDVQPHREEKGGSGTTRYYRLTEAAPAISGVAKTASEEDDQKLFIRKARAETEIVEAKAGEIKGELIPISEIEARLERSFLAVRARLLAIPPKLAPLLSPENPAKARALLDAAVLEALAELEQHDDFEGEPGGDGETEAGDP